MFNIGDEVKLNSYEGFGDYTRHKDQIATIIDFINVDDDSMPYQLRWNDGYVSFASPKNIVIVNQEWDDEVNG